MTNPSTHSASEGTPRPSERHEYVVHNWRRPWRRDAFCFAPFAHAIKQSMLLGQRRRRKKTCVHGCESFGVLLNKQDLATPGGKRRASGQRGGIAGAESAAPGACARGGQWMGTSSWRFRCAATKVHVILEMVF